MAEIAAVSVATASLPHHIQPVQIKLAIQGQHEQVFRQRPRDGEQAEQGSPWSFTFGSMAMYSNWLCLIDSNRIFRRRRNRPRLGQDKRNPLRPGHRLRLLARSAPRLADRFDGHCPPQRGSWLNRVEREMRVVRELIELCAALGSTGLNPPFRPWAARAPNAASPPKAPSACQVHCRSREHHARGVKIHWQFPVADARQTLKTLCGKVKKANIKYAEAS